MIISKVRGTHRTIPIGKIQATYLYETLRYIISIHPLFDESWRNISTSDPDVCLNILRQFKSLASSPTCEELGYYLKTIMAVLNHSSRTIIFSYNLELFFKIFNGLQNNPNIATLSKCSIYKIPFGSKLTVRSKWTTYYLLINFVPILQSQKLFQNLVDHNDDYSKSLYSETVSFCCNTRNLFLNMYN